MDTSNPPNDQHSFFIMDSKLQVVQGHQSRRPVKKDEIPPVHMQNIFDRPKPARSSRRQRQRSKSDISASPYDPSSSKRRTPQAPLVGHSDQRWPSSPVNASNYQGQSHTGLPPPSFPDLDTSTHAGFASLVQNDGHYNSREPELFGPEGTSETEQATWQNHAAGGRPLLSLNINRAQETNHNYISNATLQSRGVSMAQNGLVSPMDATSLSSSSSSVWPCDLQERLVLAFEARCGHILYIDTSTCLVSHNMADVLNVQVHDHYSAGVASPSSSVQPTLSAISNGHTRLPAVAQGFAISSNRAGPFHMNPSDGNFSFSPVEINSNVHRQKVPIEWSENPNQMPGPLWIKTSTAPENDPAIYSAMHYTSPDGSFPPVSFMT